MNELMIKIIICIAVGFLIFLPIIIANRCNKKRLFILYRDDIGILYHSSFMIKLMGACTIGLYVFVIMSIVAYEDTYMLYAIGLFLGWRVTVTYSHIYIRNGWGIEKAYSLREITHVKQEVGKATLFVGKKKIVMVGANDNNYAVLLECLRNLEITINKT